MNLLSQLYAFPYFVYDRTQFQIGLVLITALLTGCASIEHPSEEMAKEQLNPPDSFLEADQTHQGQVQQNWLLEFNDEALQQYVAMALEKNPDLQAAAARRSAAMARIRIAESALLPRLDGQVTPQYYDEGYGDLDYVAANLQTSWEIDLWGRLRSLESAALRDAIYTSFIYEYAQMSLAAQVTDAWILAITAKNQLEIDRERLAVELRTEDITLKRVKQGVDIQLDEEVITATVELARDAVTQSQLALTESIRALEILLGSYPASGLNVPETLPQPNSPIPVGIPSELLERRPDIVAADQQVAAAFYRTQAAKAAKLPQVVLSSSLGMLLDPTEEIWSIGANLLAPLYTGGELDAQIEVRTAEQKEALANYVSVALDAFKEVESALAHLEFLNEREKALIKGEERLGNASQIASLRYNAGLISILDLTQVRRQYFETASLLLQIKAEQLRNRINLHLALGGSF